MSLKEPMEIITKALIEDEGYRRGWQANIAMAFQDEWQRAAENGGLPATPEQIHEIANKAATYFLSALCASGEGVPFRMLPNLYPPVPIQVSAVNLDALSDRQIQVEAELERLRFQSGVKSDD